MTTENQSSSRDAAAASADQIGKVFVVVGHLLCLDVSVVYIPARGRPPLSLGPPGPYLKSGVTYESQGCGSNHFVKRT